MADLNVPRTNHGCGRYRSGVNGEIQLIVVGGKEGPGVLLTSAERYDFDTNTWT